MNPTLIKELTDALDVYRQAITEVADAEAREDYSRLVKITEKIIRAMRSDDISEVKLGLLAFSRQVSDAFSVQPPQFKLLASKIAEAKRLV